MYIHARLEPCPTLPVSTTATFGSKDSFKKCPKAVFKAAESVALSRNPS